MPPDTARYAAGGGAGSSVVDRTVCTRPSSPDSTAARAATNAASNLRGKPTCTRASRPASSARSRSASSTVPATGFSQNTGTPASTAARTNVGCAPVAAATTSPSIPLRSSASGEGAGSAPTLRETRSVTSGTASATTSESTAARSVRVRAWKAPIRPRPASPILTSSAGVPREPSAPR